MKRVYQFLIALVLLVSVVGGLGSLTAHAATTDDSLAKIQAKKTLVVGMSPNYPPYEFQVNRHGHEEIVGMDVEIGKQIAKDLGVKLVIKKMSFDSLLVGLETGKVDMVLSGMSPTAARKKSVDFSSIYYTAGQDILINKSDQGVYKNKNSFSGKTIGAETGTLQYTQAKKQISNVKVKGMDNATDLIMALKTHKVDGVAKDQASAEAYAQNDSQLVAINGHFKTSSVEMGR